MLALSFLDSLHEKWDFRPRKRPEISLISAVNDNLLAVNMAFVCAENCWKWSMTYVELLGVRTALICIWIAAKPRLARECVGWLEYPHSVLDETTTYKQAKSLVIGHPRSI